METLTDNHSEAKAGKRFRLTVKSAEEAVRVIREKLGEKREFYLFVKLAERA